MHELDEDVRGLLAREPPRVAGTGVLHFVDDGRYANSFGLEWNRYDRVQLDTPEIPESERRLISETGLTPESVKGKTVLEAGCGMGRFVEVVSRWGADIAMGVDLSSAVDAAARNLADRDNVVIAQSDIFDLPFKENSFDVIYSIGVLHHTPDCEAAFKALVPFVKEGGEIAISVYAAVVRPGIPWAIVLERRRLHRLLTRHIPKSAMFWWSDRVVPYFYRLDKVPVLRYFRYLFPVLLYPEMPVSWSVLDTFDGYATTYESRHRSKEVYRWFREAGLTEIDLLDSDDEWVSVRARKPVSGTPGSNGR